MTCPGSDMHGDTMGVMAWEMQPCNAMIMGYLMGFGLTIEDPEELLFLRSFPTLAQITHSNYSNSDLVHLKIGYTPQQPGLGEQRSTALQR